MVALRIVVINLPRSVERRRHMEAALAGHGLAAEFFPAVDGRAGEHLGHPQYDAAASQRFFGQLVTPGEYGCLASHYFVWQRCAAQDEPFVVMEDDIEIKPGFAAAVDQAVRLVDEFPLIRLFGTNSRRRRFKPLRDLPDGLRLVRFLRSASGTQCYVLSPGAARTLLAHREKWLEPVDRYLDRFWLHGMGHYAILPYPVTLPKGVKSDIGPRKRRKTIHNIPRKLLRGVDHLQRLVYNWRHR